MFNHRPDNLFRLASNGLVMEDEMTLDGAIISASFDEALETVSDEYCPSCLSVVAYLRYQYTPKDCHAL